HGRPGPIAPMIRLTDAIPCHSPPGSVQRGPSGVFSLPPVSPAPILARPSFTPSGMSAHDVCKSRDVAAYDGVKEDAMTKLDSRRRQMLKRIRDFAPTHPDAFPPALF